MIKKVIFLIILTLFYNRLAIAGVTITDIIKVPIENKSKLTLHAKGDQIYLCAVEASVYAWKWQAPNANMYDTQNKSLLGTHGAGPSWTYKDGSSVKAKVIKKVDAPDKSSAPWLLLEVTDRKGNGLLASVSYIQRINTQGGISPITVCDANHLGSEKRIPYSADYLFFIK
jgi:Protein of unknown function (DUF3455)